MTTETNWDQLFEEHQMAYLRADVCLGSPESFSIEEKREICECMDSSTAEVDAAMQRDFEALPTEVQSRLLDMLGASGVECREWWEDILLPFDELPDAPPSMA